MDTLGPLLALKITPANAEDREQVGETCVDAGYTGEHAVAQEHGIRLEVVKLKEVKKGFVLLPKRWVEERSFG